MDDKDDDKKRVLTPPSEWAEGMKPKSSSEAEEIDESTDWLEDDDLRSHLNLNARVMRSLLLVRSLQQGEEPSAGEELSADLAPTAEATESERSSTSDADAILTDHSEAEAEKEAVRSCPGQLLSLGSLSRGVWADCGSTLRTLQKRRLLNLKTRLDR